MLPSGISSTGWPAVRDTCKSLGVTFDGWQDGAGRIILSKRKDGTYACSIGGVVISIPRQVGKTFMIGAIVFALCLLFPGLTVLWTAHHSATANETYLSMQGFANRRKVKPHVSRVAKPDGDGVVEFHNGSRVLFGARAKGFGRGFAAVGVIVFDEAQILTEAAIDDMVPATNAVENALVIYTGTPPRPRDPSELFSRKRKEALAGDDGDTAYIEFSADPDATSGDRAQWAKANPSYPRRTKAAAMLRMKKNMGEESFMRDGLGIWDATDDAPRPITVETWNDLEDPESMPVPEGGRVAIDTNAERTWFTIGFAGLREDELHHVDITAAYPEKKPAVEHAVRAAEKLGGVPVICSPASNLAEDIENAGGTADEMKPAEQAAATSKLIDATRGAAPLIRHRREPAMTRSIEIAQTKPYSDGGVTWSRRTTTGDISPLTAVTMAYGRLGSDNADEFFIY